MIGRRIAAAAEDGSHSWAPHYRRNVDAYLAQKTMIDQKFSRGRFVGIHEGQIVADAATLDELLAAYRRLGFDPREALTVQAGDDYPGRKAILFASRPS